MGAYTEPQCLYKGDLYLFYIYLTINLAVSVSLFAWNNSAPTGRNFKNFDLSIFEKFVNKIQISINRTRITAILQEDQYRVFIISRSVILIMGNVWGKLIEKIKNTYLYSITFC